MEERAVVDAMRAYVEGKSSEPVVLSAFRGIALEERTLVISRHRDELAAIDAPRELILESLLLPFSARRG